MRLTDANKKVIRDRILRNAAEVLRRDGYHSVNIDQIMQGAGLTRGTFYSHFKSKSDLLRAVIRQEHPILRMLESRDGKNPDTLFDQMMGIFRGYLDPANLDQIFLGCSVAALAGDVTRSPDDVKAAFADAWQDILTEMARGQSTKPETYSAAFILASGAVRSAQAMHDPQLKSQTLATALAGFEVLMRQTNSQTEQ